MRKILILGASGSGKSQTTRRLLSQSTLPTFVLNDRDHGHPDYTPLAFDQVLDQYDCNVVVEDLIHCTPSQLGVLQTLCNFNARHNRLDHVILIAHSITKNGIAVLLQYLQFVFFMTTRSTVSSLSYVLTQYQFSKTARLAMQERFLRDVASNHRRYGHWVLDVERGSFEPGETAAVSPPTSGPAQTPTSVAAPPVLDNEELKQELRRAAETYVPLFAEDETHGRRAMAVLDYILAGLSDLQPLDRISLEFHFRGSDSGKVRRLSLIDYVHTVTSRSSATVHPDVLTLHAHLARQGLSLPRCFVKNGHRGLR